MKTQKADWFMALLMALVLSLASPAWAQTRAEINGMVTDASGAVLPGATVTLTSPSLVGGARTVVTKSDGTYQLIELTAGVYELTVELSGFRSFKRTGLRVASSGTVTIDASMEVAQVAETITVSGSAPTVDVKSSASNVSVDQELLQGVPTSRGISINAVNLAPGISATIAYGATSLRAITFRLDGVNTNNISSGGTLGSYANINWFEEIQVVALGAPAEYGEFTGANANQVIRSGSNRFSGIGEVASAKWESDNRGGLSAAFQKKFVRQEILANAEASAQLGGPIVHDRLFFFVGHMYYKNSVLPAGALARSVFATDHLPRTIGKINWAATPTIRLEGFLERDKFDTAGFGASLSTRPETLRQRDAPQYKGSARLTWTYKDRTLVEVRNSELNSTQTVEPNAPGDRNGPAPHRETLTGILSVNAPSWSVGKETRNVTTATVTRYADGGFGKSHDLKFGLDFERGARNPERVPGGPELHRLQRRARSGAAVAGRRDRRAHNPHVALRAGQLGAQRQDHPQSRTACRDHARLGAGQRHGVLDQSDLAAHRHRLGRQREPQDGGARALWPLPRGVARQHVLVHEHRGAHAGDYGEGARTE